MKKIEIKRILIPLDFSKTSLKSIDYSKVLAKITGAEIVLLHVAEDIYTTTDPFFSATPSMNNYQGAIQKISNESLKRASKLISKDGSPIVRTLSMMGRTHKEIIKVAKRLKIDLIVMGTHGVSGVKEFFMGSNTFRVISEAPCPVLSIQRRNKTYNFNSILVPFTDRPHSRENVIHAIKYAELYGADIHVLGIDEEGTAEHRKKLSREADQIDAMVKKHQLKCTIKIESSDFNSTVVLKHANNVNADLIVVVGDIEKEDIREYFSGSFSSQIVNHSPIPVLSIPPKYNPKVVELWHMVSQ
jgi:nucleotide-binding universal stress UspA family protein